MELQLAKNFSALRRISPHCDIFLRTAINEANLRTMFGRGTGGNTLSHFITLYHTLSHFITLYHTLSHFITLYHILSHFITLYHILSHQFRKVPAEKAHYDVAVVGSVSQPVECVTERDTVMMGRTNYQNIAKVRDYIILYKV